MTSKEIIRSITGTKQIDNVIFTACGGSLTDLYNGYYFLQCESSSMHSYWMNAGEFLCAAPKCFGSSSLVIVCSHSGNTPESVEAALRAQEAGAAVITMTYNRGSRIDRVLPNYYSIVYGWGESIPDREKPEGLVLELLNELMQATQSDYALYDAMEDGLSKIDAILTAAEEKKLEDARVFAEHFHDTPMLYILGSGSAFSQAYAMSICSLMEMQWMHCCYLHSGEYFHGPFETTDGTVPYILMKSTGKTRGLDERAERFLLQYAGAEKTVILDAEELGLKELEPSVAEYFNCPVFYRMACTYRNALDVRRGHSVDLRRYMGKVDY